MPTPPLSEEKMLEAVEALQQHGTVSGAARAMGIPRPTLQGRLAEAARRGIAPGHFDQGTAPGFTIGKVTIQRGPAGEVERTWERQLPDDSRREEALRAAVQAMAGEVAPCLPVVAPKAHHDSLLTLYTFTDFHLGALCWHKEGGDDWDTAIAERTGNAAMQALVDGAPHSAEAIVNIQGDFLHSDGLQAITPTSGHVLDADSRFGKVVEVAIRLIRQLVATALAKHSRVTLLIAEGNHDIASSLWLRKLFSALYENEPRLTVHDCELPYYAVQWGNVMLGFHHGHMRKNDQLPALFAAQYRPMWGQCEKVYLHTGHRHHGERKEHTGAEVIQHPTLAARDAYAARGGWWSERRITAYTYSKRFGEVGSNTVTPEMLA